MKPDSPRQPSESPGLPERFGVAPGILRFDAFMSKLILVGGLGVLASVTALFVFILLQVLPLFSPARVAEGAIVDTGIEEAVLIGVDEWSEVPFVLGSDGALTFLDLAGEDPPKRYPAPLPEPARITSAAYEQGSQELVLALPDGRYLTARIRYQPAFLESGQRRVRPEVDWGSPRTLPGPPGSIRALSLFHNESRWDLAAVVESSGTRRLQILSRSRTSTLFERSVLMEDERSRVRLPVEGRPRSVHIGNRGLHVVVACEDESVEVITWRDGDWHPLQKFRPFPMGTSIRSIGFLQGRVSLSLTGSDGQHLLYSLYRSPESGQREFGLTRSFPPYPGKRTVLASSPRNKALLLASKEALSLRYATTSGIHWEEVPGKPFRHLLIGSRYRDFFGITDEGSLHVYTLDDPHPEAGLKSFFGKIWYEGQDAPRYIWQSTGGSDVFEPKLSMIPLIVGSFKGTLYAMLFAVPIALLAAIYTSQFLSRSLRRFIKPAVEIMASLPSVVLGFLAALWLAPRLEDRIPSLLLMLLAIPAAAVVFGRVWHLLPLKLRSGIPKGWEFLLVIPGILLVAWVAWQLGPLVESVLFRHTDPATGRTIGDFRLWWEALTEKQFHQRNALVVGFMMGFAVIPIIYTIAEDALSSVPHSLSSGSLALGASRWQTTIRVVLPTAAAGIFSAVMIGLGRAAGETMIVVMATGNTPVLDLDVFSGMRTISANIAVELPEAPQGGTLYRTLFFGAFLLFLLTFIINTIAEVLRGRLRERYKVLH